MWSSIEKKFKQKNADIAMTVSQIESPHAGDTDTVANEQSKIRNLRTQPRLTAKARDQTGWNLLTRKNGRKSWSPSPRVSSGDEARPVKKRRLEDGAGLSPMTGQISTSSKPDDRPPPHIGSNRSKSVDTGSSDSNLARSFEQNGEALESETTPKMVPRSIHEQLIVAMHDYSEYGGAKELAIWVAQKINVAKKLREGNAVSQVVETERSRRQRETPMKDRGALQDRSNPWKPVPSTRISGLTINPRRHPLFADSYGDNYVNEDSLANLNFDVLCQTYPAFMLCKVLSTMRSRTVDREGQQAADSLLQCLQENKFAPIADAFEKLSNDLTITEGVDVLLRSVEHQDTSMGNVDDRNELQVVLSANMRHGESPQQGQTSDHHNSRDIKSQNATMPLESAESKRNHSSKRIRYSTPGKGQNASKLGSKKVTSKRHYPGGSMSRRSSAPAPMQQLPTSLKAPAGPGRQQGLVKQNSSSSLSSSIDTIRVAPQTTSTPRTADVVSNSSAASNTSPADVPSSTTSFETHAGMPSLDIALDNVEDGDIENRKTSTKSKKAKRSKTGDGTTADGVFRSYGLTQPFEKFWADFLAWDKEHPDEEHLDAQTGDEAGTSPMQLQSDHDAALRSSKRKRKPTGKILEAVEADSTIKSPTRSRRELDTQLDVVRQPSHRKLGQVLQQPVKPEVEISSAHTSPKAAQKQPIRHANQPSTPDVDSTSKVVTAKGPSDRQTRKSKVKRSSHIEPLSTAGMDQSRPVERSRRPKNDKAKETEQVPKLRGDRSAGQSGPPVPQKTGKVAVSRKGDRSLIVKLRLRPPLPINTDNNGHSELYLGLPAEEQGMVDRLLDACSQAVVDTDEDDEI